MHQAQWGPERALPPPGSLTSQSHHEKPGKLEVGGASRDSTGLGALEEGLISSRGRNRRVPLISDSDRRVPDRKSTRLNSSHQKISYAVFCLKKKNTKSESRRI